MSPSTTSISFLNDECSSQPQLLFGLYRSNALTLNPSSTHCSVRWDPIKPHAPVINTFLFICLLSSYNFHRLILPLEMGVVYFLGLFVIFNSADVQPIFL